MLPPLLPLPLPLPLRLLLLLLLLLLYDNNKKQITTFPKKKRKQHSCNTKTSRLNVYVNFRIAILGITKAQQFIKKRERQKHVTAIQFRVILMFNCLT